MKDKEMAEILAGAYQRQYHHNTYPELSDNSEFVTSKEEIKEACMYMAKWKEKQMINKAVEWLIGHVNDYIVNDNCGGEHRNWLKVKSECFIDLRKAMEE